MKRATPSGGHVYQVNGIFFHKSERMSPKGHFCEILMQSDVWFLSKRATPLAAMVLKILKQVEQT